ncbi:hypothetical protein Tsp_09167 [Trichinella spiralis]|uniref:hypothetical protein n=1 Tax=Trichinella spiralis TaxID=6334 RepID=UPI0001EFCD7F|nr:hypothetical protein Tsp_09167 [Trichinella spiralis]
MNLWLVHLDGIIVLRNTEMPASFVSQRTDISQYTKEDATRSSAQIIMTNTDCE